MIGRLRGVITVAPNATEEAVIALARSNVGFILVMLCLEVLALHLYASLAA